MKEDVAALRCDGATLALGGRTVLAGLDFSIRSGDLVGVLGPNGAGKTTFFRAALGLVRPVNGAIIVLGRPAGTTQGLVGYMPQTRAAQGFMRLCGTDFVAAAAAGGAWGLARLSRAQRDDVRRVIDLVDAGDYAHRPIGALSGGERQRLMLAQALLGAPKILLLDEPLQNLDPHHQAATIEFLGCLQKSLGLTVLLSSHELNPLLPMLDQVLYLGNGQAAIGTVDEVVTRKTLSRLYGAPIEVLRVQGRIFVMADGHAVERDTHVHV
jgi:zinc/manganese transport system ATP-binding protein